MKAKINIVDTKISKNIIYKFINVSKMVYVIVILVIEEHM